MAESPDDSVPWDRQRGEPSKSYHGFSHYRDLGVSRSVDKAWRAHKTVCEKTQVGGERRAPNAWQRWSSRWGWVERAELWDTDIDRQVREKFAKAQLDAKERHARLAQGTLTVLTAPVRTTLEALADPSVLQQLTNKARTGTEGAIVLIGLIARIAQAIPQLVNVERLALGLTTESVELDDKRNFSLANQIAKDPEAADLAIQLLDRLASTGAVDERLVE